MKKTLLKGNIALCEGALAAGCRAYFGYPITPQNEVPAYMSERMAELGGTFIQAESELASINMVMGASIAGFRAMTSSSSPGISLMQEGISYLAGCELPAVIANVQRGGPGLGNIAGSQSDYFQAVKGGGHGDYRLIVLAPATVQEMYELTYDAFDLADRYRNPVMILADGVVGQMMEPAILNKENLSPSDLPEKDWILNGCQGRQPRLIRSLLMAEGALEQHNYHLAEKYKKISNTEIRYEASNLDNAQILLVGFGLCGRIIKEVQLIARSKKISVGTIRPITLWPFPTEIIHRAARKVKKVIVVEMNLGQMLEDVRLAVAGRVPVEFVGRPGGGIPTPEEIMEKIL